MARALLIAGAFAALLASGLSPRASAECIFLKNGGIVRGRILGETGTSITVKPPDGPARTIGRGREIGRASCRERV